MSTALPTPSSYPRLAKCLGGAVLPGVKETHPRMARGTAIHAYLEALSNGVPEAEALAQVPQEWRDDCASIPLDSLPTLTDGTAELGMTWRPSTGECRLVGKGLGREATHRQAAEDEVPMVADWAARTDDEHGVLLDWKAGWADTGPAASHLQLLTYGAVYLLAAGLEGVAVYLCRPDRLRPYWDGPVVLDEASARAHLARMAALLESARRARQVWAERRVLPELSIGTWCDTCPARRFCPAQVGALLAVLEGDAEREMTHVTELTLEQAGALYLQLRAAEKLAGQLKKTLATLARTVPLPLADGTVLAEVPEVEEVPIPEAARQWLAARYGEEVADAVVAPSMTWGRMEEVLVAKVLPQRVAEYEAGRWEGRKPTKASLLKEARQGLVGAGAVERVTAWTVKAVRMAPGKAGGEAAPELVAGES